MTACDDYSERPSSSCQLIEADHVEGEHSEKENFLDAGAESSRTESSPIDSSGELDSRRHPEKEASNEPTITSSEPWRLRISKKQCTALCTLCICSLCSCVAFSCIAPFYPAEAAAKGLSKSKTGLVFGAYELVVLISAPVLGKNMIYIGSKKMFVAGQLLSALSTVAFGFVKRLPNGTSFFLISLTIRAVQAIGDASEVTAAIVIISRSFPNRVSTVVGLVEAVCGVGYTAGPIIGALLYDWKGFEAPFFFLGCVFGCSGILSWFVIESSTDHPEGSGKGILGLFRIPIMWILLFGVVICSVGICYLDPTLAHHLESLKPSTTLVGLMFLLLAASYTIAAPLWGMIYDKWHIAKTILLFGSITSVVALLIIGPAPMLHMNKSLPTIVVALLLLGIASGALYVPTFQNCMESAKNHGYDDSSQTDACVSGIFQSAASTGAFLGPTIGGSLVDAIGFPWASTILAGMFLFYIIILSIYFSVSSLRSTPRTPEVFV